MAKTKDYLKFDQRIFEAIFSRLVRVVDFRPMIPRGTVDVDPSWVTSGEVRFLIYMQSNFKDSQEQMLTLVHEVYHIFCLLTSMSRKRQPGDKETEEKSQRFLEENRDFVRRMWEEVLPRIKTGTG